MQEKTQETAKKRIMSIDALRGFDMFWIMGGDAFFPALFLLIGTPFFKTLAGQLEHSAWNGFTFYDLIFPLFLFIVGVSMPFALGRRAAQPGSKAGLYGHILKRTLILFVLGLVYNGILGFNFEHMRYAGVLQRIALCYCLTAILFIHSNVKIQAAVTAAILLLYWAFMAWIPVPDFGAGVLTPEGNLSAFIDRQILPGRFCCYEFGDNEGIFSTSPAVATTLLGVLSGHWLKANRSGVQKTLGLALAGIVCLLLGLLWNLLFPINKLIWTSSYVLYAGGWSLLLLALFYWTIDVMGWKKWAFPFVVIGLNPITIYIVQGIFDFGIIVNIFVHGFVNQLGPWRPVFFPACVLAVKWLFLYFLYKQKIFLKA